MKKEFIVNRQGKDFVLYAGLLDQAHQEGLKRITTRLEQAPTPENGNTAIVWAEVETSKGVFSGIGDANPANVGRMIAMHCIRMAETRAKARALRDAINVGTTSLEEMGDVEEDAAQPALARAIATTDRVAEQRAGREAPTPIRRQEPAKPAARTADEPAPDSIITRDRAEKLVKLASDYLHLTGEVYNLPDDPITYAQGKAANTELTRLIEAAKKQPAGDQ